MKVKKKAIKAKEKLYKQWSQPKSVENCNGLPAERWKYMQKLWKNAQFYLNKWITWSDKFGSSKFKEEKEKHI